WGHTSLLEAMMYMLDFQGARYTMAGEVPEQEGNHHPTVVPMGTFESRDGLVNVAPSSARMWADFCQALGAEDLLADRAYAAVKSGPRHRAQVRAAVGEVTRRFTTAEL